MHRTAFICAGVLAVAFSLPRAVWPQSAPKNSPASAGTISGRVTCNGKGMPHVSVLLLVSQGDSGVPAPLAPPRGTRTDDDGNYIITAVPPGRVTLRPFVPAYLEAGSRTLNHINRTISIGEGESVTGIDFALNKGGVITGKVTSESGRPLIGQRVFLNLLIDSGRLGDVLQDRETSMTDDRGVYRIYGLAPGRYLVSAGEAPNAGVIRNAGGRYYRRTYYRGTAEQSLAIPVELGEDSEQTDVDISFAKAESAFTASGRLLFEEDGKPVAESTVGRGSVDPASRRMISMGDYTRTNSNGEFVLQGLVPGSHAAYYFTPQGGEYSADPVVFEISDASITGLEIKLRKGASISGEVVVEGANDPSIAEKARGLQVFLYITTAGASMPRLFPISVSPDRSFHLAGLPAGKVRFYVDASAPESRSYFLRGAAREGAEPAETFELQASEAITGMRLVLEYRAGGIRGQITVTNGTLPAGSSLSVMAIELNQGGVQRQEEALVDAEGKFVVRGLKGGDYSLRVTANDPRGSDSMRRVIHTERVSIPDGIETSVRLVIDLSAPLRKGGGRQ